MKGAARCLFGALLGVALGYAFVLLTQRGVLPKRAVRLTARRRDRRRRDQREPAEEIAAS